MQSHSNGFFVAGHPHPPSVCRLSLTMNFCTRRKYFAASISVRKILTRSTINIDIHLYHRLELRNAILKVFGKLLYYNTASLDRLIGSKDIERPG